MSSLIPTHAAEHILEGLSEYLATSFSLAEQTTANSLKDFLTDPETGMFHGPYVRTRLPYAPATSWDDTLDWLPEGFQPYRHQAQAFARLASKNKRPEPTLVVTGTGSGKTESFLYPILDHCRRHKGLGVKALILYPMNALANDQANRLARLIATDPALDGVRAGIYTGDQGEGGRTMVSESGLINDRETLRQAPPDILLTNYKMLDQLLLRDEDRKLWEHSATTLQYVVLDEFHTYDGAQGTDVALLLRRLGLCLKELQPEGFLDSDAYSRPLGQITPVATSATLGDKDAEPTEMLEFAHTIFGEQLPADAVVRETILDTEQWQAMLREFLEAAAPVGGGMPDVDAIREINEAIADGDGDHDEQVHRVFCERVFGCEQGLEQAVLAAAHSELILQVLRATSEPLSLSGENGLVERIFTPEQRRELAAAAEEFLTHTLSEIAHLRAEFGAAYGWNGKRFPGVETHLWVRGVSRIDRRVELDTTGAHMFRWSDNGRADGNWLPACYCRSCGRSGWMTSLDPGNEFIETSAQKIRGQGMRAASLQRPLIDASSELRSGHQRHDDETSAFMWLDLPSKQLTTTPPDESIEDQGGVVPVLTYAGEDAEERAKSETCPSCGKDDSIRYLGSSVATLLSVAISNLFGMDDLDSSEKKSLVFTDSVQDAAHRAGFVQARARTFAFRTRTNAVINKPTTLAELPQRLIESADRDDLPERARFELLPPWVAENSRFRPFWDPKATAEQRRKATRSLRDVLELDLALEFGDRADLSRSLVSTGTLSVGVNVTDEQLAEVLDDVQILSLGDKPSLAWPRAILERMRLQGGVYTFLLHQFINDDGNTYMLNRREARAQGVPSFPSGGMPEFPRVGRKLSYARFGEATVALASSRSWYARWTAALLGIGSQDAAHVVRQLFESFADRGILDTHQTVTGATMYMLAPEKILITPAAQPQILECSVCHRRLGSDAHGHALLAGSPCHSLGCEGQFRIVDNPDNYYRQLYSSRNARTVVSKEHTGLLEADERLGVEKQFKQPVELQDPDAPNVLVATPTLEMGIDIGDLSTVMLASLPDTVASYVQRVGRAGRLTGNSLIIALISGRGKALARLGRPLETINGAVQPPAAFLSAREILHRQFTAFVIDSLNFDHYGVQPRFADSVFNNRKKATVLTALRSRIAEGLDDVLDQFIGTLQPQVSDEVTDELRQWARESFTTTLDKAQQEWLTGKHLLLDRRKEVGLAREELEKLATTSPNDDELKQRLRVTNASYRFLSKQIKTIYENEYWISAMERFGLLPNFTLLDDSVEFHLSISRTNADTGEFETTPREYSRGISSALYELAPGATFYVQGIAAKIDSVELGPENSGVQRWRICPTCSYSAIETAETTPSVCPACGEAKFADGAQVKNVVEMSKVYASVDYSRSAISEQNDKRTSTRFEQALSIVIPPNGFGKGWFLQDTSFGIQFLPSVEMRWLNLGIAKGGVKQNLAGNEVQTPLFRVCRECGFLDSEAGANRWQDHKPWCSLRNAAEEDTIDFALGRRLSTQGVLMHIPTMISAADDNATASLIAAIRMGFKLALGGNPNHLDVATVHTSTHGKVTPKLLLHDTIPGGTGYLAQFTSHEDIRNLLMKAYERLSTCTCKNDDRQACPDCLLPYARPSEVDKTSRESALAAITKILLDEIHPEADAVPGPHDWDDHLTEEIPESSDRTQLEAQFLEQLRADLKSMGAKVTENTVGNAARWVIDFPGSRHQWVMDEQKEFGVTRPDFYFETDRATIDRIAVYLDGAAYHASEQNNNVASDFSKRNQLSADGILPWSMTMNDLRQRQEAAAGKVSEPPTWFASKFFDAVGQKLDIERQLHELLTRDPMTQLLEVLKRPTAPWERLGLASATHAAAKQERLAEDYGPLISLTRTNAYFDLSFCVENGKPHVATWNWFLHLANLLYMAPSRSHISVREDGVAADITHPPAAASVEVPQAASSDLTAEWSDLIAEWDDEEEAAAALAVLARSGVPYPTDNGEEVHGIVTIATWREQRVALVFDEDAEDLQNQGWITLEASHISAHPDTLPDELKKAK